MLSSKCEIGSKVEERGGLTEYQIRYDFYCNIDDSLTIQSMTCKGGHEDSLNLQLEGS